MPAQSRLLPIEGYSGLDLIPFVSEYHPETIRYVLENSLLTMRLRDCHLHCASKSEGLYGLDFQLPPDSGSRLRIFRGPFTSPLILSSIPSVIFLARRS